MKPNPNWWQSVIAMLLLALGLWEGFGVPFLDAVIAIGIIYTFGVVAEQKEIRDTAKTAWGWLRSSGNVLAGVVVFLSLRFIAAKVIGLYPINTYNELGAGGVLYNVLPTHNISKTLLWELTFAMFAGQLTKMWVQETNKFPVRLIIVGSCAVVSLQLALPDLKPLWPTRKQIAENILDSGVNILDSGFVGAGAQGAWIFLFGKPTPRPSVMAEAPAPVIVKVGKVQTFQPFSDHTDSCVELTIKVYDFDFYAIGGRIMCYPPNGKPPYILAPSQKITTHYGPGEWRWCKLDEDATGVDVWQ